MSSSPRRMSTPEGSASEAQNLSTGLADTFTGLVPDDGTELREGYAELGEVKLHYVEAGDGPLVVLLHGFPEFWFGWRLQIAPLAAAGFRVVAPDTRGYNLSSRPPGVAAYSADKLADDIRGLIRERGAESAFVVGHDWGGTIAWTMAMNHPEVVDRLAILDAAHPRTLQRDCLTRASSGEAGTSSTSRYRGCPSNRCAPDAFSSSGASCATPAPLHTAGDGSLRRGVVAARGGTR